MDTFPTEVYSVASVREFDRVAIQDHDVPGYTLMTRAGTAAVRAARAKFPDARRWQVLCGAGNNAGDGYVVARLAAAEGIAVSAIALVNPAKLRGDAARAHGDFIAEGGVVLPWAGELDAEAELLVDGLLGSGLERDVGGEFAACVGAMNEHPAPVLALDIPTGLHGDTGEIMGCAVSADLTITFVGLKTGLVVGSGSELCGELQFAGLGIPDAWRACRSPEYRLLGDAQLAQVLPRRARAAHKGQFGHVLVVGGGAGMPGAVRLCGEAALRTGAGLVSVATDPGHAAMLVAARPELMPHGIASVEALEPLLERADVIAFGPGLGRSAWAGRLVERLRDDERPAVWDADALNWLAESPNRLPRRVITPHPGEAGSLLGLDAAQVQADRRQAAGALQARYGGTVVLKGAGSLVVAGSGTPWLCRAGNPGMATAGMGDVLTGIIAALLAQGLDPEAAAAAGVEIHARAGDRAANRGERGLLASDLLAELRGLVNP
jgi:NAD(P)H-hydrate epimerase